MSHRWVAKLGAALVTLLLIGLAAAPAWAQTVIEARGTSDAGDRDRQKAIDRAFAEAVRTAVSRELTTTELRRGRATIEKQLVRRARLYVKSYRVLATDEIEGGITVTVSATIDRDGLLGKLTELGLRAGSTVSSPNRTSRARPRLVVVLYGLHGEDVHATFGSRGGDGGPAATAIHSQLAALGFELASARGRSVPTTVGPSGDLLVEDGAAAALAREVGAGGVLIVGLQVRDEGRIRGTGKRGAAGEVRFRVLDLTAGNKVVASSHLRAAGFSDSPGQAMAEAARALGERVGNEVAGPLVGYWPGELPIEAGDARLVLVRGASSWASVTAVIDRLRAVPGSGAVNLRRLRANTVVIAVDSKLGAGQLAGQLSSLTLPLGTASASIEDGQVVVDIDGDDQGGD